MTKLFIVGFPRDIAEVALVELFSAYGTVESVTIVTDKETGKSKGYGFITMTDQAGAERAIAALDGTAIEDRKLNVREADDRKRIATDRPHQSFTAPHHHVPQKGINPAKKKRPRL